MGTSVEKAPFDISINAHTHEFDYLPKGKSGNPFPVIVGAGYQMDAGTVMILRKMRRASISES